MDEKIIEMMKEMRQKTAQNTEQESSNKDHLQQSVQEGSAEIDGETIEFVEKSLLKDKIKIRLPKNFEIMSPEIAALKYPSARRPNLIYTNESASINITFNHTQNALKDTEMDSFKDTMIQILKKMQPSAQWFEDGVENINEKNIGYCEALLPALDVKIYSLMFFAELEARALLCTFNCTEEEMEDWQPVARGIMESLKVCPGEIKWKNRRDYL